MTSYNKFQIEAYVYRVFSKHAGLTAELILSNDLTLSEIVDRSEALVNSVDLMECFAKIANGVRREFGIRVRLPAFPMETKVSVVIGSFLELAAQAQTEQATQEAAC